MKVKAFIIGAFTALLVLGGAVGPASATHPQVQGVATCNTTTGLYDVVWTVTSDPGYTAGGTFTSATRVSSQIVGKTVAGSGAAVTPAPTETVATNAALSLTVGIQFTNHSAGDIVYNTGSATFNTPTCEIPLPGYREIERPTVYDDYACTDTEKHGVRTWDTYTYSRAIDGSIIETADTRTQDVVTALTAQEIAAKAAAPECQPTITPTPTPPPATLPVSGPREALALFLIGGIVLILGILVSAFVSTYRKNHANRI